MNPSTLHLVDGTKKSTKNVEVRLISYAIVVIVYKNYETHVVILIVKAPSFGHTTSLLLDHIHKAPIDLLTVLDVSSGIKMTKL